MNSDFVIDTSVVAKLFVQEALTAETEQFFARFAAEPSARLFAPELIYAETAHVLWKYVRFHGYDAEDARHNISDLLDLGLITIPLAELLPAAFYLASFLAITVYDACYAALAVELERPLVTVDKSLARKLRGHGLQVQTLQSEI